MVDQAMPQMSGGSSPGATRSRRYARLTPQGSIKAFRQNASAAWQGEHRRSQAASAFQTATCN